MRGKAAQKRKRAPAARTEPRKRKNTVKETTGSAIDTGSSHEEEKREVAAQRVAASGASAAVAAEQEFSSDSEESESEEENGEDLFIDTARAKGARADEDDDEEEVEAAAEAGSGKDKELIDVSFTFVDPRDVHFKSVRLLLREHALVAQDLDASDMAEAVVAQKCVGTMVAVEGEEDDAYAFGTVLPLDQLKDRRFWSQFASALAAKCPPPVKDALQAVLAGTQRSRTGLLLNQRMINMPPQISPPLLNSLVADIRWARDEVRGGGGVGWVRPL